MIPVGLANQVSQSGLSLSPPNRLGSSTYPNPHQSCSIVSHRSDTPLPRDLTHVGGFFVPTFSHTNLLPGPDGRGRCPHKNKMSRPTEPEVVVAKYRLVVCGGGGAVDDVIQYLLVVPFVISPVVDRELGGFVGILLGALARWHTVRRCLVCSASFGCCRGMRQAYTHVHVQVHVADTRWRTYCVY
jgi:hypothetical protein